MYKRFLVLLKELLLIQEVLLEIKEPPFRG